MQHRNQYEQLAKHLTTIVRHSAEVTTTAIEAEKLARKLSVASSSGETISNFTREVLAGRILDLQQRFARVMETDREHC